MEAVSAPPPGASAPDTRQEKWGLPLAVLVVGMLMSVLDISIVNVAIPTMQRDFDHHNHPTSHPATSTSHQPPATSHQPPAP